MGRARGDEAAPRCFGAGGFASRRQYRPPRSARACRRGRGVAGNPADRRARRIAAAGAGAIVDVAGIPEEMTMDCCESQTSPVTSRRALLLGGASFAAWAYLPKFARASNGPHAALMLDSFFALHPAMPEFARMYREKRAAVIHAVATSYRDRSHFDGQDVLESGFAGPGRVQSGWLNRALEVLPRGERVTSGLAIGPTTPLVLRGAAPTVGWAPVALPQAADDTAMRLVELYNRRDPALASALSQGLQLDKAAQGDDMKPKPGTNGAGAMKLVARGAAKLMAADDGPRIAALAFDGWDTHANEGGPVGRLAQLLSGLDGALAEFESGLGERWRDTVVVVATEFGRTARINGTEGTDHGTGTVALLAGGAVKGGRVISDWPGLKTANLYEGRDLAPTTDLRAVIKGVLHDHLGLAERVLADTVFPDSAPVKAMKGLVG